MKLKARFYDGTRLDGCEVEVGFYPTNLTFWDASGKRLQDYMVEDLLLVYTDKYGDRVDLGVASNKDIRLIIEEQGVRHVLAAYVPQVTGPVRGESLAAAFKVSAFLIALVALAVFAIWQLERIVPWFVPDAMERRLGQYIANGYVEQFGGRCTSEAGEQALQKMADRLLDSGVTKGKSFRVQVANHELVNAFAAPGGEIVLFNGLIQGAASPEEVAGVLAHEIGHEQHKHVLKGLTRSLGVDILGSIFGGSDFVTLSKQMLVLSHSRSMEEQADKTAIEILHNTYLSAAPLAGFFLRIEEEQAALLESGAYKIAGFFSTHPDSRARAAAMLEAGGTTVSPVLSDGEWRALKGMCPPSDEDDSQDNAITSL